MPESHVPTNLADPPVTAAPGPMRCPECASGLVVCVCNHDATTHTHVCGDCGYEQTWRLA